ncbi:MAG TPA: TIGR02281 family clan AA aspartic protease [Thiotrichales bacterium]|nr:TIGR02281 family clan AA aspartic protease [Thiotrichales bacterium]
MIAAAWILFLGLLTLYFQDRLAERDNPNRDPQGRVVEGGIREVVLVRNRWGHYVASGAIDGHPVTFLLDTGATDVSIPQSLADRIGLERGRAYPVTTANGTIRVWSTRIATLELGAIRLHNVRASIRPGQEGEEVLLGMSALGGLELIQKRGRLTLRQHP